MVSNVWRWSLKVGMILVNVGMSMHCSAAFPTCAIPNCAWNCHPLITGGYRQLLFSYQSLPPSGDPPLHVINHKIKCQTAASARQCHGVNVAPGCHSKRTPNWQLLVNLSFPLFHSWCQCPVQGDIIANKVTGSKQEQSFSVGSNVPLITIQIPIFPVGFMGSLAGLPGFARDNLQHNYVYLCISFLYNLFSFFLCRSWHSSNFWPPKPQNDPRARGTVCFQPMSIPIWICRRVPNLVPIGPTVW